MMYGVLGLGSIGLRHATNLRSLGKRVIAFDPSGQRLEQANKHDIVTTSSREEIFDQSRAIVISSPNKNHLQDLKDCVSTSCHVFVEKPLAHTTKGVDILLDEATARGLQVFVGFNLRFHPAVVAAKKLLVGNEIGRILWGIFQSSHYLPSWRPEQDYQKGYTNDLKTGGVIFDIIHEFDLATFLLGSAKPVVAASLNTGFINITAEDCADIVLRHKTGLQSVLHLDYVTRPTQRLANIGGSKGILKVDLVKRNLVFVNSSGTPEKQLDFNRTNSDDDYIAEMKAFIKCVEGDEDPVCDGYAALEVLEQVILARQQCGLPAD